jgi:hypothetical protein
VFFEHYQAQFAGEPAKPVLFSETVPEYLGEETRHLGIVRLLWGTLLGGAGVVFQNDTSWGFASRAAMAARAADRDAVLDLEGHAARFFNDGRVHFARMRPDGRLSSTGVCLANPEEEYVIYAPGGEQFTADLSGAKGRTLSARWYDPTTGRAVTGEEITGGSAARPFKPPFARDAVLHVTSPSSD